MFSILMLVLELSPLSIVFPIFPHKFPQLPITTTHTPTPLPPPLHTKTSYQLSHFSSLALGFYLFKPGNMNNIGDLFLFYFCNMFWNIFFLFYDRKKAFGFGNCWPVGFRILAEWNIIFAIIYMYLWLQKHFSMIKIIYWKIYFSLLSIETIIKHLGKLNPNIW